MVAASQTGGRLWGQRGCDGIEDLENMDGLGSWVFHSFFHSSFHCHFG